MIPQTVIDEIVSRVSIVDVIGSVAEIRKSGRNYQALCPFHQEKSPSFSISEEKGLYHCFGCGASGNTLKFMMEYHKLTFKESVTELARMAGVDLSQYEGDKASGYSKERETLLSINREAMQYFHQLLLQSEEAGTARAYLKKRKMTLDTVKNFRLGYAGASWNALTDYLKGKGYQEADLIKSGVVGVSNSGLYNRFKDRVIFPILDRDGNPVGFGGRILTNDKQTAKYLNSAENPVFHKGNLLFGLYHAKDELSRKNEAILVEGYMDVIALQQNGVKHAVAPLGTSLTESQLGILKRYSDTLYFVFDGDDAGVTAANRALDIAASSDFRQWAVILPGKKDPYDVAMESGGDGFIQFITEKRLSPIDFKLRYFAQKMDKQSEKVKLLASIFPYIVKIKSAVAREGSLKKTADFLGEKVETILTEYQSYLRNDKSLGRTLTSRGGKLIKLADLELDFIGTLLNQLEYLNEILPIMDSAFFFHDETRSVFELIKANPEKNAKELVTQVENQEILNRAAEIAQMEELKPGRLTELAYRLQLAYIKREMTKNSAGSGDLTLQEKLKQAAFELENHLKSLAILD